MNKLNTVFIRKWADAYLLSIENKPDATFERTRVLEQLEMLRKIETKDNFKSTGGYWLGVARGWIQQRCINGSDVIWGSHQQLQMGGRGLSVSDIEELVATCAAEAINEFKGIR